MAIFHLSVKAIQRSKGASVVAKAAYRSCEKLKDLRMGVTHDYTRKKDLIGKTLIGYSGSRESLWNKIEKSERRKNSTLAKEYEVSLPKELNNEQHLVLAIRFGEFLHSEYGCVCDVCVHDAGKGNPHMHILTTTKSINHKGEVSKFKISREWDGGKRKKHKLCTRRDDVKNVRETWEKMCNQYCAEQLKEKVRIDHRSLRATGQLIRSYYQRLGSIHKQEKRRQQAIEEAARVKELESQQRRDESSTLGIK